MTEATLQRARLTIDADADSDGTTETGVFEMYGNATVVERVQPDYVVQGALTNVNSAVSRLLDGSGALSRGRREGAYMDLGGGQHFFEIEFQGWEGSSGQWGDGSGSFPADATGDGPLRQMQCLMRYLKMGITDSGSPAKLEIGEYTAGGAMPDDHVNVAFKEPQGLRSSEEQSVWDGSIIFVEVLDSDKILDGLLQRVY